MKNEEKYRLVTRSDLDGIISAALLKKIDKIDEITLAHPKDVQDGKVKISDKDIVANLPFVDKAHMAFDYNLDTSNKKFKLNPNHAIFTDAQSVSQIIYEYYGASEVYDQKMKTLVEIANKSKSANYTKQEILDPKGWTLLNFLTDPRTGLGRFKEFDISNYELMKKLPDMCLNLTIDEMLQTEDIKQRVDLYNDSKEQFKAQLHKCVKIEGDIATLDLRDEKIIYPGNRFMIYALFPETTASIHIISGKNNQNTVFSLGKSTLNRSNDKDIYKIVKNYGGGGHSDAGSCQVENEEAEQICKQLVESLKTKHKQTV
jgi:nanoRNase/pAp phosphatase (c-di-AMP/oligoRNAs hydrolase)